MNQELILTIAGVTLGFAAILITMLHFLESRRTRYDMEHRRMELADLRQSIEHQMHMLTDRLLASESRWREVNHLLLSSQSRQQDVVSDRQDVPLTPFVRAAGVTKEDLEIDRNLVFVLTPFSDENNDSFRTIAEVCNELGMRAARGDEELVHGEVFPHILRLMLKARILIANIEGRNPNVLYELGLAHALGKTTILVAKAPDEVPFDVRAKKLVLYRTPAELREKLRLELARSLAA